MNSNQLDKSVKQKGGDKFYNPEPILKLNATYNIIIGKRSNGKTYAFLKKAIMDYANNQKQSAYVRRYREDFRGKRGDQLFAAHVKDNVILTATNGEYSSVKYYAGRWYFSRFDEVLNKEFRAEEPFCFGFSLSEMEHDKSTSYPNITNIIFDEFLSRQYYLKDEFIIFMNVISTIVRNRFDVSIYMLGNTVNKYCPYFVEMGLNHVKDMELGKIDLYTYGNSELTVAVERCHDPESSRSSNKYFTFDNPSLQMITGGAWEIDIYPHCPRKYLPKDVQLIFIVIFDNEMLQGDIVVLEDCYFAFLHRKTTPIQDEDSDLIFSTQYDPRLNWCRNIIKPTSDFHKRVSRLVKDEQIFYQDNEVGEIFRNYIMWCKSEA